MCIKGFSRSSAVLRSTLQYSEVLCSTPTHLVTEDVWKVILEYDLRYLSGVVLFNALDNSFDGFVFGQKDSSNENMMMTWCMES